jgi:teichuronopeptide biosynthesis TupA-like protein
MSSTPHDRSRAAPVHLEDRESLFRRVRRGVYRSFLRSLPESRAGDRLVSIIQFFRFHKRLPNRSMSYNDVLHRIKTSDDILDPLRVFVTDKEFLKLYVRAVVGDTYVVPTLDVIKSKAAIDAYEFPAQCCIKATHTSGRVILRKQGEPVDRALIKSWFDINYYRLGREANYKSLKPKVIVEPILFGSWNLKDYKIFCVNGTPKLIQVDVDRYIKHKRKYFDAAWNEQPFSIKYPRTDQTIPRPGNLDEMLSVAARLSRDFGFVRVDLYSDDNSVYVGEITHCADNADGRFMPASAEKLVSDYLFRDVQRSA